MTKVANRLAAIAIATAAALGVVAGGLAVAVLPADRFAWTGIALVPLFVLLEAQLKRAAALFEGDLNATRLSLAGAIVLGFYAAWFGLHSS